MRDDSVVVPLKDLPQKHNPVLPTWNRNPSRVDTPFDCLQSRTKGRGQEDRVLVIASGFFWARIGA